MLAYLLSGIAYGFAAAVTPGPLSFYLISQAVTKGWRRALPAAFSPLITDGPVALLVLVLLSRVPPEFLRYLRIVGGLFILYLAYESYKSWRSYRSGEVIGMPSNQNTLLRAAIINWLNPNLYIGWSVILGPVVLSGWHESPAKGISLLVGFYLTMTAIMLWMVFMFSAAKTLGTGVRRVLLGLSCAALLCVGLYQLWLGLSPYVN